MFTYKHLSATYHALNCCASRDIVTLSYCNTITHRVLPEWSEFRYCRLNTRRALPEWIELLLFSRVGVSFKLLVMISDDAQSSGHCKYIILCLDYLMRNCYGLTRGLDSLLIKVE